MSASSQGRPLLGLLGCVAAMLFWWLADEWRQSESSLSQRQATLVKLLARAQPSTDGGLAQATHDAEARRNAALQRLSLTEEAETARAGLYYALRQHCESIRLTCQIQLARPSSAGREVAERSDERNPSESLGIQRMGVRLTGNLGGADITSLFNALASDVDATWRVKGLVVKGRAFEMDVERVFVPSSTEGQAPSEGTARG